MQREHFVSLSCFTYYVILFMPRWLSLGLLTWMLYKMRWITIMWVWYHFHCPLLWQQKTYIIKCSLILWSCQVSLFFTETPTNPFLRCIDVEHVSNMCRSKGALLCIDSTFASPINQKALTLGADLVIHSATKYIAGHNDVSWYTETHLLSIKVCVCTD